MPILDLTPAVLCRLAYLCLGLAIGGLGGFLWADRQATAPTPGIVTVATPAKVLTKIERVAVPCTVVQAYKPAAKRKLKLPTAVVASPTSQVLASSDVRATEHDTRISTVLDTSTGAVDTYTQTLPLPWLRPEARGEVGLYYGVKPGHIGPVGRLVASYDVMQVKAAHVGVMGSLDTDGAAFAGIGVRVRW